MYDVGLFCFIFSCFPLVRIREYVPTLKTQTGVAFLGYNLYLTEIYRSWNSYWLIKQKQLKVVWKCYYGTREKRIFPKSPVCRVLQGPDDTSLLWDVLHPPHCFPGTRPDWVFTFSWRSCAIQLCRPGLNWSWVTQLLLAVPAISSYLRGRTWPQSVRAPWAFTNSKLFSMKMWE